MFDVAIGPLSMRYLQHCTHRYTCKLNEWYAVLCTLHHVPFVLTVGPVRQSTMHSTVRIDKHL